MFRGFFYPSFLTTASKPKRFDQARQFLTLGLVVTSWLIIPTILKSFTRTAFFEFTNPVAFHH
jgi:hypothetical protein